jgi:hypothetical protein
MFLLVLIHTLHAHQLVASETELFKFCVGMFTTNEGIHRLGIFFETWVSIGSNPTNRLFVRGDEL